MHTMCHAHEYLVATDTAECVCPHTSRKLSQGTQWQLFVLLSNLLLNEIPDVNCHLEGPTVSIYSASLASEIRRGTFLKVPDFKF